MPTDGEQADRSQLGPDFLVRLRPLNGRPTRASLGMLLKVLGRYYGLQCRDAVEVPADNAPIATQRPTTGCEEELG